MYIMKISKLIAVTTVTTLLLGQISAHSKSSSDQVYREWEKRFQEKINLKEWMKYNPAPYRSYYNPSKECAERWTISLGPLGVSTLMHDRSWFDAFEGCQEVAPKELTDEHGLFYNAFEVKHVKPNSPASGKIEQGDLIIQLDQQFLNTSLITSVDKKIENRKVRGIEMHAGEIIDRAEGKGTISVTVLRVPEGKKNAVHNSLKGLRSWNSVKSISASGDFSVMLNHTTVCRFKADKGTKVENLTLSNDKGISFPVEVAGKRGSSVLNSEIQIPPGQWQLSGSLTLKRNRKVEIEVLPQVKVPKMLLKYCRRVNLELDKIGSFGTVFNPTGEKARNYSKMLAHRIATQQNEDGSWSAKSYGTPSFYSSICGVALMSTNDPQYAQHVKKAAYYVANGPWCKWSYVRGMRLIFLSEYYLRTKDRGILPAIKLHIEECRSNIHADYTSGHGTSPGYGGSGYIGGGGMIACGLAIASHTPAASDEDKAVLDKMLERVQQISPGGKVPYGRANKSSSTEPVAGDGGGCGTGPYFFASLIRGGAPHFVRTAAKRYGQAPWGSAENGHAAQTLHFVWGVLASSNCGSKALRGCMSTYAWKFTTLREYDGFVNENNYRVEYHNGDGVIGPPYWRTAGYLLLMNAHKRNLAITGSPKYRAKKFKSSPLIFHRDSYVYNYLQRSWYLAEAALGKKAPKLFKVALKELESIPQNEKLGLAVRSFLKRRGLAVAKEIMKLELKDNNSIQIAESILGLSFEAACAPNLEVDMDDDYSGGSKAKSSTKLSKADKKELKKQTKSLKKKIMKDIADGKVVNLEYNLTVRPFSMIQADQDSAKGTTSYNTALFDFDNIKVEISDPSKKYLKKKMVFIPKPGSGGKKSSGEDTFSYLFKMNNNVKTHFDVAVSYTVNGVPFSYKSRLDIPAITARSYVPNLHRIKVRGTVSEDYRGVWTTRVKLNTGKVIGCEQWYSPTNYILAGTSCEFEISPTGQWGHNLRSVKKLNPNFRVAVPSSVSIKNGSNKNHKHLYDIDKTTSLKLSGSGTCEFTYSYDKPVQISSVYVDATSKNKNCSNKLGLSVEAKVNGRWQVIRAKSGGAFVPTLTTISNEFRISFEVPKGGCSVNELVLNRAAPKRSVVKVKAELTW